MKVAAFLAQAESSGNVAVAGHNLTLEDLLIDRGPKDARLIATELGVTVLLDTKVTEDLLLEGYAREVVSRIQNLRKESGLQVTDKIHIQVTCDEGVKKAITAHKAYIMGETLGVSQDFVSDVTVSHKVATDIDGVNIVIGLVKA